MAPGAQGRYADEGLTTPGATMRYKVYVVLDTSNERGSNAVAVTHPL